MGLRLRGYVVLGLQGVPVNLHLRRGLQRCPESPAVSGTPCLTREVSSQELPRPTAPEGKMPVSFQRTFRWSEPEE